MLSKKLALVTGAARGIGEATAKILAREGAQIVICDLDENNCQKIVKSMENPNKHLALEIDITKRTSVSHAIEKIQKHFDKPVVPDIVVNCAGIIKPKTLLKMSDETFDSLVKRLNPVTKDAQIQEQVFDYSASQNTVDKCNTDTPIVDTFASLTHF